MIKSNQTYLEHKQARLENDFNQYKVALAEMNTYCEVTYGMSLEQLNSFLKEVEKDLTEYDG